MIISNSFASVKDGTNGVNLEQLAFYHGIGRFISVNTHKQNWGVGVIDGISERLRAELAELPGLMGNEN